MLTIRCPGARIAPTVNNWACRHTRDENSGANGARRVIISAGRVIIGNLFSQAVASASTRSAAYSATNASRLASSALSNRDGLVRSEWQPGQRGPGRRAYTLTAAGR